MTFFQLLLLKKNKKIGKSNQHSLYERGRRGIRTPKGACQRIYSPPRLSNSGVRPFKKRARNIFLIN